MRRRHQFDRRTSERRNVEQDVGTICRNSILSHFEVCRTLWAYRVIGVVQRLA